jgi:DNA-binding MarR family transcriptional regulator
VLQNQFIAFIRAFGLHRPEQTPCGEPVSVAETHALIELSLAEQLSQHDLARRLRLEKSTISRLVGLLEGRAWIIRTRGRHDRRMMELRLSGAGRQAAAQLSAARQAKFARLLGAIPAEQRPMILAILRLLTEALHAED